MLINHKYHVAKIHIKLFIYHIVGDATKKKRSLPTPLTLSSFPSICFYVWVSQRFYI